MSETEIKVSEKDKPFILALVSAGLFAGEIAAAVYMAVKHPDANLETLKNAITATSTLMTLAWTYYLSKKKD
jgi:hypothetical protein